MLQTPSTITIITTTICIIIHQVLPRPSYMHPSISTWRIYRGILHQHITRETLQVHHLHSIQVLCHHHPSNKLNRIIRLDHHPLVTITLIKHWATSNSNFRTTNQVTLTSSSCSNNVNLCRLVVGISSTTCTIIIVQQCTQIWTQLRIQFQHRIITIIIILLAIPSSSSTVIIRVY